MLQELDDDLKGKNQAHHHDQIIESYITSIFDCIRENYSSSKFDRLFREVREREFEKQEQEKTVTEKEEQLPQQRKQKQPVLP